MPQGLEVNPSTTLIVDLSRVIGGRQTISVKVRDEREGVTSEVQRDVTTIIEDVNERAHAEKLRAQAAHVIKRASVHTVIGELANADRVPEITSAMEVISERVAEFNSKAKTCKVTVGFLPLPISVALGPEAARALADHVREELQDVKAHLQAGETTKVRADLHRIKNLGGLAVGMQRDAITFALENVNACYQVLKTDTKDKGGLSETSESVGRTLDVSSIDNAIQLFTY